MNSLEAIIEKSKHLTLLYVEDNKDVVDASISVFEEFFSKIFVARNGADALEIFQTQSIDLLITDVNMPVMNGLELIKNIQKVSNIPIWIFSAHDSSDEFIRKNNLSIDTYLTKPISIDLFLNALDALPLRS